MNAGAQWLEWYCLFSDVQGKTISYKHCLLWILSYFPPTKLLFMNWPAVVSAVICLTLFNFYIMYIILWNGSCTAKENLSLSAQMKWSWKLQQIKIQLFEP